MSPTSGVALQGKPAVAHVGVHDALLGKPAVAHVGVHNALLGKPAVAHVGVHNALLASQQWHMSVSTMHCWAIQPWHMSESTMHCWQASRGTCRCPRCTAGQSSRGTRRCPRCTAGQASRGTRRTTALWSSGGFLTWQPTGHATTIVVKGRCASAARRFEPRRNRRRGCCVRPAAAPWEGEAVRCPRPAVRPLSTKPLALQRRMARCIGWFDDPSPGC
jgi:hypothetical protein